MTSMLKRYSLLTFLLILISGVSYSSALTGNDTTKIRHTKRRELNHKEYMHILELRLNKEYPGDDCVETNKYSIRQRLAKYPFNKAVKILAVSYPGMSRNHEILIDDTTQMNHDFEAGLHVSNGVLDYCSIIEAKELTVDQIAKLTSIIYNTRLKKMGSDFAIPGHNCYFPRNALLFFDKNGKIFDYLEICFQCEHYSSLSEKLHIGMLCNQKYDMLKKFLIDVGLEHGTQILD